MGPGFVPPFFALAETPAGGRRRVGFAHPPAAGQARQRACSGAGAYGPGPGTPPPPADAPADATAAAFGGRGSGPGGRLLGLPNERASSGPLAPGSLFQGASRPAAAPRLAAPSFPLPMSNRHRADRGALAWGSRLPLVRAGGAAAFCGPLARKTKAGRGPRAPAHALCALCAPAAPPGPLGFSTGQAIHPPPLFALASCKQNERAAPDERPAGIIRWKPEKVIQLVFPRFFQKRAKGLGAEPPTGSGAEPRRQIPYPNALRKSPTLRQGPRRG